MNATLLQNPSRLRFEVRVQPRASRERIAGVYGGALKIQLTAPPVDGAANAALLSFLALALGVAKSAVHLVAGEHGRTKVVEVHAESPDTIRVRLEALAGGASAPSVDKTRPGD